MSDVTYSSVSIPEIFQALGGKMQSDGSAMVRCPAHPDETPSCHVTSTGDKILVRCHAGCSQESVISALEARGLWPANSQRVNNSLPKGIPYRWDGKPYVIHWEYRDVNGAAIGYVVRYEDGQGKLVIPFFRQSSGKWKAGAPRVPRPLYRMDCLSHDQDKPVLIPEGEKTTDAANRLVGNTYVCISWQGGSGAVSKADWSILRGRAVIVWPDADGPGAKAAEAVKEQCLKAGATAISIVNPPQGVKTGWDLADAESEGWTGERVLLHIEDNMNTEKNEGPWDGPVDMSRFIFEIPPTVKWFADNRIPLGRAIILTGLGGSSKTRVLYMLSIGAITGSLAWSWEILSIGRAVLVLTEDTAEDVHRIIHSLTRGLAEEQRDAVAEGLVIYPLAGKDTRLLVKTKEGTVEKSSLYKSLVEKIRAIENVVFVGLDPALSLSEGDETDQGHQRALGKAADDMAVNTGATVCLVSHATKASLQKQELTSHNSRGGGAITDAVRAEYSLRNMTIEEANKTYISDIEERKRHVQLVATKGNSLPPSAYVPVWLRRDDFGNLTEADIEMDGKGTLTDRDMEVLKVHSEIGAFCSPKLAEWRAECVKRDLITGTTENAQRQAMKRVLDKLLNAGLITKGLGRGIYTQNADIKEPPF